jgi:CheY-like chemotaxis protein
LPQITVLYVEDHDLVLFTVKQLLELEGWRVQICRDGAQALKLIASEDHFELILLDSELPSVNGLELVRRARRLPHRQATPIIIFTARDCADEAAAVGANACLKKPGGIKDLLDTCSRVLNHDGKADADAYGHQRAAGDASKRGH